MKGPQTQVDDTSCILDRRGRVDRPRLHHAGLDSPTAPLDISFLGLCNQCLCRGLECLARRGSIRRDSNRIRTTPLSPHAGEVTAGVILDHSACSTLSYRMTAEAMGPDPLWVILAKHVRTLAFSCSFSISSHIIPLFERSTPVILNMPLPVPPQCREMRSCLLAVCVEDLDSSSKCTVRPMVTDRFIGRRR